MVTQAFWAGRRVFLTGHTGFKGSWLSLWLNELGAQTSAYALAPPTTPSLYEVAQVENCVQSTIGDIRDPAQLAETMRAANPEIIFHLAAQPLVNEGYRDPVGTYATNVMGTVNLLEIAKILPCLRAIVIITTDKCYANQETGQAYRESDPLGGHDPYSSSKACTEIISHAYRQSFLAERGIHLATARAGNVIGGGDWAANRLIPDLLQAFANGKPACLRAPEATRPWQHVLEPLSGYLELAEQLYNTDEFEQPWNFGPNIEDCVTTVEIATRMAKAWGNGAQWFIDQSSTFPHEAKLLRLDASKANKQLHWQPKWSLNDALEQTVSWHRAWLAGQDMQMICRQQITQYSRQ